MASTSHNPIPRAAGLTVPPVVLLMGLGLLLFCALPWSLEHKAHMFLHGLCAQRPSHTYYFGERALPFDARMTGIYLGYLATTIALIRTGALRYCRQPTVGRIVLLLMLGGVMVVDGFNSLLRDLKLPYPYEPHNWLRVATGMSAGVVLAVGLGFLLGSSLWSRPDPSRQTLHSLRPLVPASGLMFALGLLVSTGSSWLYAPLTMLLIIAALGAVSSLALVVIVILTRRDFSFASADDLNRVGMVAVATAVAVMLALSIGRTLLDSLTGPPTLT